MFSFNFYLQFQFFIRTSENRLTIFCGAPSVFLQGAQHKLEGKYSLESTDPRESEIRAPPQPLPYLMPIPPTRFL